jgi:hypothetical protein
MAAHAFPRCGSEASDLHSDLYGNIASRVKTVPDTLSFI